MLKKEIKFLKANPHLCMGCKNCELACTQRRLEKSANNLTYEIKTSIYVTNVEGIKSPIHCMHCEEAYCMKTCPTNAFTNRKGVIYLDDEKCIGCGICEQSCPYGVISMIKDLKVNKEVASKCDMCLDRQENNESPVCYLACPVKALELV